MTSLISEGFEGGAADTAVDGSNTSLSSVVVGANGAAITFDDTVFHLGALSARVDVGSPPAFTVMKPIDSATDIPTLFMRFYVRFASIPAANATFGSLINGTTVAQMQLTTTGNLRIRDGFSTVATTTAVLAADTWYGVEWAIDTTGQTQTLRLYDADHTDVVEEISGAYTKVAPHTWQLGNVTGNPDGWAMWFDDLGADDATWVGPLGTAGTTPDSGVYRLDGTTGAPVLTPVTIESL